MILLNLPYILNSSLIHLQSVNFGRLNWICNLAINFSFDCTSECCTQKNKNQVDVEYLLNSLKNSGIWTATFDFCRWNFITSWNFEVDWLRIWYRLKHVCEDGFDNPVLCFLKQTCGWWASIVLLKPVQYGILIDGLLHWALFVMEMPQYMDYLWNEKELLFYFLWRNVRFWKSKASVGKNLKKQLKF